MTRDDGLPVGVIGAGGSGLLAAAALVRAGLPVEILEARDGVGGTWRYDPDGDGSACYASLVANTSRLRTSPSLGRIPGRPWGYAPHRQMAAYFEDLTDRLGLRRHLRLNWRVARAAPDGNGWELHSEGGETVRCRALVCALGVNGRPRRAALNGTFSGEQLHSARCWTAAVLAGELPLPPADERQRVAHEDAARRVRDFGDRREFLVDHGKYMATLRRDRRNGAGRRR